MLDLGRFFSFLIVYTVGGTPWTADQPVALPLPAQDSANAGQNTDIHASCEIRTQEPSVWAGKDCSCRRPRVAPAHSKGNNNLYNALIKKVINKLYLLLETEQPLRHATSKKKKLFQANKINGTCFVS
jgi:hypothetical protein